MVNKFSPFLNFYLIQASSNFKSSHLEPNSMEYNALLPAISHMLYFLSFFGRQRLLGRRHIVVNILVVRLQYPITTHDLAIDILTFVTQSGENAKVQIWSPNFGSPICCFWHGNCKMHDSERDYSKQKCMLIVNRRSIESYNLKLVYVHRLDRY